MSTNAPPEQEEACFHCGLPIELTRPPHLEVGGQERKFCCHGCKAVCEAIIASGNLDYYDYRDRAAATATPAELDSLLGKLPLYDRPEIQKDFVRHTPDGEEAWLILENIHCAACLWLNERYLRQLDGVLECEMDYTSQQARVRWDPARIKLSDILLAISRIGYIAHPFDPARREALQKEQQQRSVQRLIFAVILGMTVMNFSLASYVFGAPDAEGIYPLWIRIARWTNLLATGLLLAYPGQLFFRNAWADLRRRRLGMDVPVALGMLLAWLGSLKATVTGTGEVYFESIAMFVVLLLLARHVELRARVEAAALLDQTAKIIPKTAQRLTDNGTEEVFVADLQVGQRILLSPGEMVPTDAKLIGPETGFDEALLTGESLPVLKRPGDSVPGGSVNVDQAVTMEVERVSAQSTLTGIHELARSSVNDKPHYVQLADRLAGHFIAVILSVAALTWLTWSFLDPAAALGNTISVLIVTCPCALALASPVALTLCSGGLAKLRIVPVHLSAIEAMAKAKVLVLDKTGTLTRGRPILQKSIAVEGSDSRPWLAIAAALEAGSEHPIAKAFQDVNPLPASKVRNRRNWPGAGVEGQIDGVTWRLGTAVFVSPAAGWLADTTNQDLISDWQAKGGSALYLGDEQRLAAVFLLADPLRSGARDFVAAARQQGFRRILVLSGDHPQTTRAIASVVGADEAHGGLSPTQKQEIVRRMQRQGDTVLMLGDGLNDAPVLASADISMAVSDATDLARSHSDFLVLAHDLSGMGHGIALMRKTRRIIIQNMAWAVGYNLLGIPAAAAGLITPGIAAVGMSASSLIVVVNSLRLRRSLKNHE